MSYPVRLASEALLTSIVIHIAKQQRDYLEEEQRAQHLSPIHTLRGSSYDTNEAEEQETVIQQMWRQLRSQQARHISYSTR